MSRWSSKASSSGGVGVPVRILLGTLIVLSIGYLGVIWGAPMGLAQFWPYAGLWAAVGWGASRLTVLPFMLLIVLGVSMDLLGDAPIGCWAAIHLLAFLVSSLFRKRSLTDPTGFVRAMGDLTAFVTAFIFARWIMGAYVGNVSTREVIGGFLSAGLLYIPLRSFFLLSRDNRVD
jgi:hypothetical protein